MNGMAGPDLPAFRIIWDGDCHHYWFVGHRLRDNIWNQRVARHGLDSVHEPACEPTLHRSYFDLHRLDWTKAEVDPGGIEFNLPISSWLRLFRETGFEVLDYLELQAPEGSPDRFGVPGEWAQRWPPEQVWKLRRTPQ